MKLHKLSNYQAYRLQICIKFANCNERCIKIFKVNLFGKGKDNYQDET